MILSELKKQVDFLCDNGHGDNPVLVTLSESSISSRAVARITGIHSGFDWESEQVRISTEKKIISYGKDRDNAMEPRREDYDIGTKVRHLLLCPKCQNQSQPYGLTTGSAVGLMDFQLRKDDNYCSNCGQRVKKWR